MDPVFLIHIDPYPENSRPWQTLPLERSAPVASCDEHVYLHRSNGYLNVRLSGAVEIQPTLFDIWADGPEKGRNVGSTRVRNVWTSVALLSHRF